MPNFGPMATEVGAVSTLYKPFQPAVLLQAIEEAVHPLSGVGVRRRQPH